jgi:hypothetical protein
MKYILFYQQCAQTIKLVKGLSLFTMQVTFNTVSHNGMYCPLKCFSNMYQQCLTMIPCVIFYCFFTAYFHSRVAFFYWKDMSHCLVTGNYLLSGLKHEHVQIFVLSHF